jgi:hypothetical protein
LDRHSHHDDRFIKNGRLDTPAIQPIARYGYADYAVVDKVFSIPREGADREQWSVIRSGDSNQKTQRAI